MHLKSKEKASELDFIPSHGGEWKFEKWRKASKCVSINPRFVVITAVNTIMPIVLWDVTLHAHAIISQKTTVLNIDILVYLTIVASLFPLVHFNLTCHEQCVC
jgi:hypothetical protein